MTAVPALDGWTAALSPRRWSIRTRTAVAFGGVFALLAGLVLVGVAAGTSQGVAVSMAAVPSLGSDAADVPAASPPVFLETGTGCGEDGCDRDLAAEAPQLFVSGVLRRQQLLWSGLGVVVASLLAAAVGWFVSGRMLRPLDEVVETARGITATTLHERIGLVGPRDEVARVAETIDELLDRLEASFEAQRRFVAYASHELRTPLAVQRAALQIGLDDPTPAQVVATREQLLEVNRSSEHLIESLLALATADRGVVADADVHLGELVGEVVAGQLDRADDLGVEVVVARGTFSRVRGDAVLLGQLVRNLVDNAVEYNVPGGCVRVHGAPDAVLVVENTGPVVSAAVAAALAQPFTRGHDDPRRPDRSGGAPPVRHSGLGLAIVASVARAHGWSVDVGPRGGGGLRVVVR
ncbi:signal transduction histidine kinase [Frigoribacterium sp. PhB160]|uniref:sensor histidine kinase n=1 Tax=Frigoribacterium sp. PhB160 TaxID=2485192 RepID=UPI000F492755|nr:HAMP domain-containing sensor histidine kinase [Frigoribacterium sp. PhB160]ROS57908.1 signal transduction histidine kinase [Frigoribacterium sp. PhB160]